MLFCGHNILLAGTGSALKCLLAGELFVRNSLNRVRMVSKADVDDLKERACRCLAFVCEFVCVYIGVRGELPDVVWANCLLGPKHRNFL